MLRRYLFHHQALRSESDGRQGLPYALGAVESPPGQRALGSPGLRRRQGDLHTGIIDHESDAAEKAFRRLRA
jgi:hypothetical protein